MSYSYHLPAMILGLALAQFACQPSSQERSDAPKAPAQAAKAVPAAANDSAPAAQAPSEGMVHDPLHPPVDCPLRKAGIDPTQMKPFEQIEAYIQFLERPDRAAWQKPDEVVQALQVKANDRVLDLGAGSGYFSFPIARAQAEARVFAADVEPEMIRHIHHQAMLQNVSNIEVMLLDAAQPKIPDAINVVLMCDVLHHVADPVAWMTTVVQQLPENARFFVIEFNDKDIPEGPPKEHRIPKARIQEVASQAGLKLTRDLSDLLPYQFFLEFTKPAAAPTAPTAQ